MVADVPRVVNARQLEVLRWVAEGCPDGRWPDGDFTYKTTAGALKGRGLVAIKGHARSWQATITEAGTYSAARRVSAWARWRRHSPSAPDCRRGAHGRATRRTGREGAGNA